MFDPEEIPGLKDAIRQATLRDRHLLDVLREEIRVLKADVKRIQVRHATSVSLVASDGGNNKLVFDPFHVQLVRVVDSQGKRLCLDAVTPHTDTAELSGRQFDEHGEPQTALGRLMRDLKVKMLHDVSPMIPDPGQGQGDPSAISSSWVMVYRDLCEWAALYELIVYKEFANDTLIVRDGLLRSKIFSKSYFIDMRRRIEEAIALIRKRDRRRVFLVGLAKKSKVLERYRLAMALEGVILAGEPRYVRIPRDLEAKAYVWDEYARGAEAETGGGELPKFVAGDMYFVRFGGRTGDPIWCVDILSSQSTEAQEVFGTLLQDSIDGFPVPLYPRCLQRAHEHAEVVDFDLEILQDEVMKAVREVVGDQQHILEGMRLQGDLAARRYE